MIFVILSFLSISGTNFISSVTRAIINLIIQIRMIIVIETINIDREYAMKEEKHKSNTNVNNTTVNVSQHVYIRHNQFNAHYKKTNTTNANNNETGKKKWKYCKEGISYSYLITADRSKRPNPAKMRYGVCRFVNTKSVTPLLSAYQYPFPLASVSSFYIFLSFHPCTITEQIYRRCIYVR